MNLNLLLLESRIAPSGLFSRNGAVLAADDNDFVPFPDFRTAAHATAGNQFTTVVGAGIGGGPRVQVRTEGVVTADYFAYESTFRDGVLVAHQPGTVVTGTNPGGGPVVAVWDEFGVQRSRFFAEDPDFRGGISVAIADDIIYTVPGPGGGPVIRAWTLDGVPLGARFGAHPDSRDGWDIIVGDATGDGIDDITLSNRMGRVSIVDGVSGFYAGFDLPDEYSLAGYEGESLTVGHTDGYLRGRVLFTSFDSVAVFDEFDAGAGNPSLPLSTGTRPGVYRPIRTVGSGPPDLEGMETLQGVDVSGSVGTINVGTGSAYVPMRDASGNSYIVTASHVARRSPFFGLNDVGNLLSPGRLDGQSELVGFPEILPAIPADAPYTVDAVAYRPVPGTTLSPLIAFDGETVPLHGVAVDLEAGDLFIAVGRGRFAGSGTYWGPQVSPVSIRWPSGEVVAIAEQYIAVGGPVRMAEPGFSGGVVFRVTFVGNEDIRRELVGMTVAGNATTVFITPHAAVAGALGLTY
jgi:hypothetical protein